jgi:hypothetical protein
MDKGIKLTELSDTTSDKCAICWEGFLHNDRSKIFSHPTINDSKHNFHPECIETWVDKELRKQITPTCPLCKVEL